MKIFDGQKGKQFSEAQYFEFTHKRCPRCSTVKIVGLFHIRKTRAKRGWSYDSHCIPCCRKESKDYGAANKPKRNARLSEWRKKNPAASKHIDKRRHLKQKYGITPEQVEQMREQQGGRCAICDKTTSRLWVDHCHTKGHLRALLCQTCNTFLGWYEKKADTILKFQAYTRKHANAIP